MPFKIPPNIDPKGEYKVKNDRRPEGHERCVDKIQTYL